MRSGHFPPLKPLTPVPHSSTFHEGVAALWLTGNPKPQTLRHTRIVGIPWCLSVLTGTGGSGWAGVQLLLRPSTDPDLDREPVEMTDVSLRPGGVLPVSAAAVVGLSVRTPWLRQPALHRQRPPRGRRVRYPQQISAAWKSWHRESKARPILKATGDPGADPLLALIPPQRSSKHPVLLTPPVEALPGTEPPKTWTAVQIGSEFPTLHVK
jgi:hypothetical protein